MFITFITRVPAEHLKTMQLNMDSSNHLSHNWDFVKALDLFKAYHASRKLLKSGTLNNYCSWLRALDKHNGGKTMQWIRDSLKGVDRLGYVLNQYASMATTNANTKSALTSFANYILSSFDASNMLSVIDDELLVQLIAQTAIFAHPDTKEQVKNGSLGRKENRPNNGAENDTASWDNCTSIRNMKLRGQTINGIYQDDNTRANQAIKRSILHTVKASFRDLKGFEACHIWGLTNDQRYYTSVMNLVLVPRALASLTDHSEAVKDALKYRAFELFGFVPVGQPTPKMPKNYNKLQWR
jgi:hypothetical protein